MTDLEWRAVQCGSGVGYGLGAGGGVVWMRKDRWKNCFELNCDLLADRREGGGCLRGMLFTEISMYMYIVPHADICSICTSKDPTRCQRMHFFFFVGLFQSWPLRGQMIQEKLTYRDCNYYIIEFIYILFLWEKECILLLLNYLII